MSAELSQAFNDVQRLLGSTKGDFVGGLNYRIERSRFYVQEFRKGVGALRIRRIEGFQQYDQFVERRLGSTFDYIDMLGHRYKEVLENVSLLYQYCLAQSSAQQASELARSSTTLVHLQNFGEFALIACLLPYYASYGLDKIIKWDGINQQTAWAAAFGLGLMLAAIRLAGQVAKSGRTSRPVRRAWRLIAIVAIVELALVTCLVAGVGAIRHWY